MELLYKTDYATVSSEDFTTALKALGVKEGGFLFVHSDIRTFGKMAAQDASSLMSILTRILQKAVGETGTLAMPTFSYSWGQHGGSFDKKNSNSTVGALTNFFRKQPGVTRTIHPFFSIATQGPLTKRLLSYSKSCFGAGTIFDTLVEKKATLVFFGTTFEDACTLAHHIEQMASVPYRYNKDFTGTIIDGAEQYQDTFSYFVRPLDGNVELDLRRFSAHMKNNGLLREVPIGNSTISAVGAEDTYREGMDLLAKDPYFFLKNRPTVEYAGAIQ